MTGEYITTGVIEGGKLEIRNRAGLSLALRGMKDGEVLIRIERLRATRSAKQNAWYWGVIVQMRKLTDRWRFLNVADHSDLDDSSKLRASYGLVCSRHGSRGTELVSEKERQS